MNYRIVTRISFIILLIFLHNDNSFAQDTDKSLALKKNQPYKKYSLFYQPDLSYQIQRRFNLIRDANSGNSLAQHELGLRYLLGEDGLPADTAQGALWVEKAAIQNLTAACYNYGILLLNGWGVEWNPYKAFDYFMKAANDGMAQAQYIVGILYTDNLIVKRNYFEAYRWLSKSSDNNYLPAQETIKDLMKYLPQDFFSQNRESNDKKIFNSNTKTDSSLSSQLGLVFIDFESIQDTIRDVTDAQLIQDLFLESNIILADTLGLKSNDSSLSLFNFNRINELEKFAESGNPEALTVLGRLYEEGIIFKKDLIRASENYILASQINYPRAKILLLKIISQNFMSDLISEIKHKNNPSAMFVFYGLWSLGLYHNIIKEEANKFLIDAANLNYTPAVIELANTYFTGKLKNGDMNNGIELWKHAASNGSFQARIRLSAANILERKNIEPIDSSITILKEALELGSVLAQITLAYAYEKGLGVPENKAEAVKYYRSTAQRGNLFGYNELKRMYDEIRPYEKKFQIN